MHDPSNAGRAFFMFMIMLRLWLWEIPKMS